MNFECLQQPISAGSKPPTIVGFHSGSKDPAAKSSDPSHDQTENSTKTECVSRDLAESEITCVMVDFKELSVNEPNEPAKAVENGLKQKRDDSAENDVVELDVDKTIAENSMNQCEGGSERTGDSDGEAWNEDSDDEDSWITPANYEQACEKMGGALETGLDGIAVGCITTDYAIQVGITGEHLKQWNLDYPAFGYPEP